MRDVWITSDLKVVFPNPFGSRPDLVSTSERVPEAYPRFTRSAKGILFHNRPKTDPFGIQQEDSDHRYGYYESTKKTWMPTHKLRIVIGED